KKGEVLIAENEEDVLNYALDEDILVTEARIQEIKTVYLDEHIQLVSPDPALSDIRETEVYKADHPVVEAADYLKSQSPASSWKAFGESQFELSDENRTMEDADLGLLIASPILYQTEGLRNISLILFFEKNSFNQMLQYFRNYAKVT